MYVVLSAPSGAMIANQYASPIRRWDSPQHASTTPVYGTPISSPQRADHEDDVIVVPASAVAARAGPSETTQNLTINGFMANIPSGTRLPTVRTPGTHGGVVPCNELKGYATVLPNASTPLDDDDLKTLLICRCCCEPFPAGAIRVRYNIDVSIGPSPTYST